MRAYAVANTALTAHPKLTRHSDYLRFIRRQPCVVCGALYTIEAAHSGVRGLGQKADDLFTLPLCRHHHRTGPHSHHKLGKRFWGHHALDRVTLIRELQRLWKLENGNL
jgi:hypothetical protein